MNGKEYPILLTGANGQLGQCLQDILKEQDTLKLFSTDIPELDITNENDLKYYFKQLSPAVCINAAAYTAVDKAEEEPELAGLVNGTAPGMIAQQCFRHDTLLIHVSTDYVYHSITHRPLLETDPTDPKGVYAKSKWQGELAVSKGTPNHVIIRTSWLYSEYGHNFVKTMIKLGRKGMSLRVVNDQFGAPTYAKDLASAIVTIIHRYLFSENRHVAGIYNFSNAGDISWYHFARQIFTEREMEVDLHAIPSQEYPVKAIRPQNSRMNKDKICRAFDIRLKNWKESLEECLKRLEKELP